MKASSLWNENKERFVPSATVRKYLEESGWEPSDFELAALIHDQKHASLAEKFETLRSLDTEDAALAAQIKEYIQGTEQMLRNVMKCGQDDCIYKLSVRAGSEKHTEAGYYRRGAQALAVGLKFEKPFLIHKYAVFQGEGDGLPDFPPCITRAKLTLSAYQDMGWVSYGKDGAVTGAWSPPSPLYDEGHFTRACVAIPTPFKVGDIVFVEREGITRSYREYGVVTPGRGSEP